MSGRRTTFVGAAAVAVMSLAAEAAYGQSCIGVPIAQGSYGGRADVSFEDGSTTYGASVIANLAGRLSLGAGYGLTTADGASNAHSFSGQAAFELPGLPLSLCPLTELRYFRASDSDQSGRFPASSLTVPLGVALAHPFSVSPNVSLTPYAAPQFLIRVSAAGADGDGQPDGPEQRGLSDTAAGLGLRKGGVVGIQRFFGGLDVELTSLEGSEPVYRILLGVRF